MASLQQEPSGMFHIVIRVGGKRFKRSLKTKIESNALSKRDEIDETLTLLKRKKVAVPEGTTVIDFLLESAGVNASTPKTENETEVSPQVAQTGFAKTRVQWFFLTQFPTATWRSRLFECFTFTNGICFEFYPRHSMWLTSRANTCKTM